MRLGTLILRAVIGPLFIGHGTQKLFGWFGGHGTEGTGGYFENLGLRPGKRHAITAGTAEALGGLLVTLGALTPVGATMISSTMVTAIRKVHAAKGPWITEGGFEYNAVLIAAMAMLVDVGPGPLSVDEQLLPELRGPRLAALSLASAVVGSYLATAPPLNESDAGSEETPESHGDPAANGSGDIETTAEPATASGEPVR
jgi:putative oxidoreductase